MNKDYTICIPTYKRPGNIKAMEAVLGTENILWAFNDAEDHRKYEGGTQVDHVYGGSLIGNRNALLKRCEEYNNICVMLDDDLVRVQTNSNFADKKENVQPLEVIDMMVDDFRSRPQTIAGMSPTDNDFFAGKEHQENKFLIASLLLIKPVSIYFDPKIPLKEDYEICANHIQNSGGTIRYNRWMWSFRHYKNTGGCQADDIRSKEREWEAVKYLETKYPGAFRRNPKRDGEVIMQSNVKEVLMQLKNQTSLF